MNICYYDCTIYLEELVDVIPNECSSLIGLFLSIQLFQTMLKGGEERAITGGELLDGGIQLGQLC